MRLRPFLACLFLVATTNVLAADGGVIFSYGGGLPPGPPDPFVLSGRLPALCRINYQFRDTDRQVRLMRGIPSGDGNEYRFAFHDNDASLTSYYGLFEWTGFRAFPEARQATLFVTDEQTCSGRCRVLIPPVPATRDFALAGFDFEFADSAQNILEIAIVPNERRGIISVNFTNDAFPEPPYLARVAYVTFERDQWERRRSRSTDEENSVVLRSAASGTKVLRGFRARFRNGDHFLQQFEIDVCRDRWLSGVFRDSDGVNDPYILDVEYSFLDVR